MDRTVGDVAVRLFIECKFVPSHSVFWFAEKDHESAQDLVCASGTYPRGNNQYTHKHHYLARASVAKLFATGANRAQESDPFYKALNQALNAMVSMRGRRVSVPVLKALQRTPRVVIEFPVVLCSSFDQMYAVDFEKESEPRPIVENFQLEVRYAYIDRHNTERDEYFLLDFVEFNQLDEFAAAVARDAEVAALFVDPG